MQKKRNTLGTASRQFGSIYFHIRLHRGHHPQRAPHPSYLFLVTRHASFVIFTSCRIYTLILSHDPFYGLS